MSRIACVAFAAAFMSIAGFPGTSFAADQVTTVTCTAATECTVIPDDTCNGSSVASYEAACRDADDDADTPNVCVYVESLSQCTSHCDEGVCLDPVALTVPDIDVDECPVEPATCAADLTSFTVNVPQVMNGGCTSTPQTFTCSTGTQCNLTGGVAQCVDRAPFILDRAFPGDLDNHEGFKKGTRDRLIAHPTLLQFAVAAEQGTSGCRAEVDADDEEDYVNCRNLAGVISNPNDHNIKALIGQLKL